MNKNLKNFMSIVMIGTVLSTGNVYARDFKDITPKGDYKWAYESVNRLQEKNIFGGYEDGTFKPSRPVSFLETMQIIRNIKNPTIGEIKEARSKFGNISKKYKVPSWSNDAICYALYNNTITEATLKSAHNRGFLRDINIVYPDRNSVTVYFGRALGFSENGNLNLLKHKDKNNIAEITKGYLANLIEANIYSATGSDGMFNGKKPIRRVEIAVIADKTIKYLSNNKIPSTQTGDLTEGLNNKINGKINLITLSGEESKIKINNVDYRIFVNNVKINDNTGLYKGDILSLTDSDVTAEIVNNEVVSLTINKMKENNVEKGINLANNENVTSNDNSKNNELKLENSEGKVFNLVGKVKSSNFTGDQYEVEVYIIASDTNEFVDNSTIKVFSNKEFKIDSVVNIRGLIVNNEIKDLQII